MANQDVISKLFGDSSPSASRGVGFEDQNSSQAIVNRLFYKDAPAATADIQEAKNPEKTERRGLLNATDDAITRLFGTNMPDAKDINAEGRLRVQAEQRAQQQAIEARRAELGTDAADRGYLMKTFDSAAGGAANFIGSTAEYLGRQFGIKSLEEAGQKAQIDGAALTPKDQDLLQKVATGLGSALPMMVGGVGTGVAAGVATGSRAIAGLAGSAAGAALESPSIAQEAYEGALKETGNEAVAERQGYKAAAYNLPLSFITNKLGLFGDAGGRIAQTAKTIGFEGLQEGGQKALTNVMGYQPTGQGVSEEALIGGLTGGVLKQFTYSPDQKTEDKVGKPDAGTVDANPPRADGTVPPAQSDQTATVSEVDTQAGPGRLLNFQEMYQTLNEKPAVAAVLYQDAETQEQKDLIRRVVDRAEIQPQFEEALGDLALTTDVRNEMANFPEFMDAFQQSLDKFANEMPASGIFKPSVPLLESMREVRLEDGTQAPIAQQIIDSEQGTSFSELTDRLSLLTPRDKMPVLEVTDSSVAFDMGQNGILRVGLNSLPDLQGVTPTRTGQIGSLLFEILPNGTDLTATAAQPDPVVETPPPAPPTGKMADLALIQERFATTENEPPANFKLTKVPANFNKLAKAFGVQVVAYNYTGTNGSIRSKAGMALPRQDGKAMIAINMTRANQAGLFVFGHEVFHVLEQRFPVQAAQLAQEVKQYLSQNARDAYTKFYDNKGQVEKTDSEIAADVMGQMFTDRQFWRQVGEKNPSLLERVLDVIDSIIDRFRTNAESNRMQIGKELAEYEKVRDMVASFVGEVTAPVKPAQTQQTQQAQPNTKPAQGDDPVFMDDDIPVQPGSVRKGKPAQQAQAPAPESKPADDAKALEQVLGLLREKKIPQAAKLFKENDLFGKGFGSFTDLQKLATQQAEPEVIAAPEEDNTVNTTFKKTRTRKQTEEVVEEEAPPTGQLSLGIGQPKTRLDTPSQTKLRDRIESIIKQGSSIKFYNDTVLMLQKQIADIDAQIKALDEIVVREGDGTISTFRARREEDERPGLWGIYDMNAYDRFMDGLVPDKPTTKMELQQIRGQLATELDTIRARSTAARASLYRRSISRMTDQIMTVTKTAISGGMPEADARAIFNEYFQALSFREQLPTETPAGEFPDGQAQREAPVDPDQINMFDGARVVMGLIMDSSTASGITERNAKRAVNQPMGIPRVKVNESKLESLILRGLREGDFTPTDVADAFRAMGLSMPRGVVDLKNHVAMQMPMTEFVARNGNTMAAVREYVVSMEKVMQINPGSKARFSPQELALHNLFYRARRDLEVGARRKVDRAMRDADNATEAFQNLLFNRFSLDQIRNPQTITAPADQGAISALGDRALPQASLELRDAVVTILGRDVESRTDAWFQDVAYALVRRPDLEASIFERLTENELSQYRDWIARKKAAIAQEAEIMGKEPAFALLRNMKGLNPELDSRPVRATRLGDTPGATIQFADSGVPQSEYEREYVRIANAELSEIPQIMDSLSRLNAILVGKVDPDTGEILSDTDADEMASSFIEDLEMRALKTGGVYDTDSNVPAAMRRGDTGTGTTLEDRAEQERRAGGMDAALLRDESVSELQDEGIEVEMEGGYDNMFDAREDIEPGSEEQAETTDAAPDVADTREERQTGSRLPTSLTDQSYRFRRGPFAGALVPSLVADHIFKITAKWPAAPRISILPNADHLPQELRDKVKARLGKHLGAKGLYADGQVYLFSDHLADLADAEFTLFHEAYGHLGLRSFLGARFDQFLQQTYNVNPEVRRMVDAKMADEPMGLLEAVDEVLSDMAAENRNPGLIKTYTGRIINGLRELGFEKVAAWLSTKTDAELAYVLQMAKRAAQNGNLPFMGGAPGEVRLAEARLPYEMFTGKGGITSSYARYNPLTASWAVFTATGNDIRQGWNTQVMTDYNEVLKAMRKQGNLIMRSRSGLYIDFKLASDFQKYFDGRIPEEDRKLDFSKPITQNLAALANIGRHLKRTATINFQNEYKAVMEVIEDLRAKGRMQDAFDLTGDLDGNLERRMGEELADTRKVFEKPLLQLLKEASDKGADQTVESLGLPPDVVQRIGKDTKIVDAYLTAKHAAERNAHVARINKNMPDGGSGMFTKDADAVLRAINKQTYKAELLEMSNVLAEMSEYKVQRLLQSGMISSTEAAKRSAYKNYVTLSGVPDSDNRFDDSGFDVVGAKLNTKKDKMALGRSTVADDIVARTILSFEKAVVSANKNSTKQKLLSMLEYNYDPDFAVINRLAYKRVFNRETQQVEEQLDSNYLGRKDVMIVHVNGIPSAIQFKDRGKGTFADAIHGSLYPPEMEAWPLRMMGQFNRVIGQMLTTWNPVWSAVNFTRDAQTLYFNSVADKRVSKAMAKQMVQYLPKAIGAAFHVATDGKRAQGADTEMIRYYNQMRQAGGATSFLNLRGLDQKITELERMLKPEDQNAFSKAAIKAAEVVESFNIPLEMAPRIAAFRVMKENGFSTEEAARFAGEITVNFNMRGASKWTRQWFLFFNPAVQGSAKLVKLAAQNPKVFGQIAAGMAATGFIMNIIARALSEEDDDGVHRLDKLPVFKRATSMIIPNPFGERDLAVPIPYGWNAFYAAGHFMADTLWAGTQSPGTTAKRILQSAFESFSPVGSAGLDSRSTTGTIFKGLAPTALLPFVEIALNENRFGAPIIKEESLFGIGKRANAYMGFESASPLSAGTAKALNKLTGGNMVQGGVVDVNPGIVDHLIGSYLPGIAAETYKAASWATRVGMGYETKSASLPLVDRLTTKVPDGYDYGSFRRASEVVSTLYDDYKLNPGNRKQILAENPNLSTAKAIVDGAQRQIQGMRAIRSELEAREDIPSERRVELVNRTRAEEKLIVNKAVRRIMESNPQLKQKMLASE